MAPLPGGDDFQRLGRPQPAVKRGWKKFGPPLETKNVFFYFPSRHRKVAPGRLMGPGTADGHRSCPVPLLTILLLGGSGYAHL